MNTRRVILAIIPLVLLIGIVYYLLSSPFLDRGVILPNIIIEKVEFKPGHIVAYVRNTGQDKVIIAQADIDDAPTDAIVKPTNELQRLSSVQVIMYHQWIEGRPYEIGITTSDGTRFTYNVLAATLTPESTADQLLYFALVGTYVGIVPVTLGLLWYPSIQRVKEHWHEFFLSLTAGLLLLIAIEGILEAFDIVHKFTVIRGEALILLSIISVFLLLNIIDIGKKNGNASSDTIVLYIAYLIAVGIGLHNLGEGLAIGAASAIGEVALTKFLIIGFAIHNVTEGFAIVAPLAKSRVKIVHFIILGIIAGVPTIFGGWVGGLINMPIASTIFLAVGVGAIFQVIYIIFRWMISKNVNVLSTHNVAGFITGMLIMYLTGLFT